VRLNRDEYLAGGKYSFERAASFVLYEPHRYALHDVGGIAVKPVVEANADVATRLSVGRHLFRS
jgi:hypothetical protein